MRRRDKKYYRIRRGQPTRHLLRRQGRRRFWLGILFLVIFGTLFYFLIFSSFFQVEKIIISGNERVSKEEIEVILKKNIEKKILFFPTQSIFLTNLNNLRRILLDSFPQIDKVEIGRGFPDVLKIIIGERSARAVFCQAENCFLLDNDGIIFAETQLEDNLIKIINRQEVNEIALGKKVIEKEYLEKIFKIQEYISEELEFEVEEFAVFEERLNVKTTEDWEIYFDPRGDLNWQLTKLNLVLKEKIPSERRKDLEYIELRFGDLAPFRYR